MTQHKRDFLDTNMVTMTTNRALDYQHGDKDDKRPLDYHHCNNDDKRPLDYQHGEW